MNTPHIEIFVVGNRPEVNAAAHAILKRSHTPLHLVDVEKERLESLRLQSPEALVVMGTDVVTQDAIRALWALGADAVFLKDHPSALLFDTRKKGGHLLNSVLVDGQTAAIGASIAIPDLSDSLGDINWEILKKSRDAMACVNDRGVLTFCNTRFSKMMDMDIADMLGEPFQEFVTPAQRGMWLQYLQQLQSGQSDAEPNLSMLTSQGTVVEVAMRGMSIMFPDVTLPGTLLIMSDLSDMHYANHRVKFLERVLDFARFEAILTFNREGAITECNQTAESFFGKAKEMLLGDDVRDLFRKTDGPLFDFDGVVSFVENSQETLASGAYNKPVPVEVSVAKFIEEPDRVPVGIVFVRDISERKGLQQLKDEFLRTTSHELRTPLAIVMSSVENLQNGIVGVSGGDQKLVISRIRDNCEHLGHLINDLLDLSRLATGKAKMRRDPADMVSIIKNVSNRLLPGVREKGLDVELDMPDGLPWVYIDADMIARVVTNLMANAIRYAETHILVKVKPISGKMICVTVADDGPGIKREDATYLFEKFVQINRRHGGAGYKGTGLGLAICKHIMDAHEGRIWLEDTGHRGSQFSFELPVYDERRQLRLFLEESVAAAAARTVPLSLITVLALAPVEDPVARHSLLNDLKHLLHEKAFRKTDTIFILQDPSCLVLAVQEGRQRADKMLQRIDDAIRELKRKQRARHLELKLGLAVYPDEVQDIDKLFQIAIDAPPVPVGRRRFWAMVRRKSAR
jgi:PAS domain S-box-containing protein